MTKGTKNLDKLYGNNKVYSPSGSFMFMGNNKKINWYLKHTPPLAEIIDSGTNDEGIVYTNIKLLFEPDGEGHDDDDPYYLTPKENICVVSGSDELADLTKHHVVPYCFRKHFPLEYKDRSSHDILLITSKIHYEYENKFAMKLKNKIAEELGLLTHDVYHANINRKFPARALASTVLRHSTKIPMAALLDLMIRFEDITGLKATRWDMEKYLEDTKETKLKPWGETIVDEIIDFQSFSERWRAHFLESMKPEFMPTGWDVKRKIVMNKNIRTKKQQ